MQDATCSPGAITIDVAVAQQKEQFRVQYQTSDPLICARGRVGDANLCCAALTRQVKMSQAKSAHMY